MLHDTCYMIYDFAIIGSGPAGLSASVYASRYGISNVVIGGISGGLTTQTHEIGNWLGTEKISGFDFAQKAEAHCKSYDKAEVVNTLVDEITEKENGYILFLSNGSKIEAKTILLAMGTKHRHLGVPGEKEFAGKGVSYCATCDGFFYRGKTVAVIGGNDSAAGAAVYLGDIAEKVYLIYRGEKLRCETFWGESIGKNPKIESIFMTNIKEIKGENKVEELILDSLYKNSKTLKVDGVFAEIGSDPNTELIKNLEIELDEQGYVKIDTSGRTSKKGIWAAGDITTGSDKFKQIITAAAEGAVAAHSIQEFLKK
ncbi:MAG: FAD-dependent oxidoreductase [Candidatus Moranbacteria bacterium]|nr:FAD-dependent oxidoreductase [Candidatus Moranbacteria bacterium]